ncbi:MAG: hypothetical protein ACE1ZN_06115, partial [Dehalococcoidia bacterium]
SSISRRSPGCMDQPFSWNASGACPAKNYLAKLLSMIERGKLDPTLILTHSLSLEDAPHGYDMFANHKESCVKVVLKP